MGSEQKASTSLSAGLLHPGTMGAALGAELGRCGHSPVWLPAGRSEATRQRAEAAGFESFPGLEPLCRACSLIIGICPPHAAEAIARQVAESGFRGLYLEANAISPERSARIRGLIENAGAGYVDGAVIGPPALEQGDTRLLLCGRRAGEVADFFRGGSLQLEILERRDTERASALKMCDSAMRKGELAMLCATFATAEKLGVGKELERLWRARPGTAPYLETLSKSRARLAKAWRFAGEMEEVADTFAAARLPEAYHRAAAETFRRLAAEIEEDGPAVDGPFARLHDGASRE